MSTFTFDTLSIFSIAQAVHFWHRKKLHVNFQLLVLSTLICLPVAYYLSIQSFVNSPGVSSCSCSLAHILTLLCTSTGLP